MPYYPTLEEDVKRAKAMLAEGKPDEASLAALPATIRNELGGTIYGKDVYAAYKLLESFVAAIEAVGSKVCELALRAEARSAGLTPAAVLAGLRRGDGKPIGPRLLDKLPGGRVPWRLHEENGWLMLVDRDHTIDLIVGRRKGEVLDVAWVLQQNRAYFAEDTPDA